MSPTNAARENGGESRSAAENFPLSIVYRVCVIGGEGIVQVIRRNRGDLATPRPIGKSESDRQRQISQKAPPPSHSPLPSRSCCQRMAGPIFRHQKRKIEGKKARDDALSALFYLRRSRQIRERKVLLLLFLLFDLGGLFSDLPCKMSATREHFSSIWVYPAKTFFQNGCSIQGKYFFTKRVHPEKTFLQNGCTHKKLLLQN